MSKIINVAAYGYYGAGNLGDELLLRILINWALEIGASVTVLSFNPEYTKLTHNVDTVLVTDLMSVIKAIQNSDLLILGGGGLFQTHHDFFISALYRFNANNISAYARPILMAKQLEKPVLLWAQGIGPLQHEEGKQIVREIFSRAEHVSVRDNESALLLEEIGVHRNLTVAPDPVWTYAANINIENLLATQALRLAIVLRLWSFSPDWIDRFVKAINDNYPPEGCTLVWVPFQVGELGDDLALMQEIKDRLDPRYAHEWCLSEEIDQKIQAIAACRGVVAMRLHAQILALKMGKTTLCIEYDEKMSIVSRQAKIPAHFRLAINASDNEWDRALHAIINHNEEPRVSRAVQCMIEEAINHRRVLQSAIESIPLNRSPRLRWSGESFDWIEAWMDDLTQQTARSFDLGNMVRLKHVIQGNEKEILFLKQTVMQQERIISDLNKCLLESNNTISSLIQSESWKITSPLRSIGREARIIKSGFLNYLKHIYWSAPVSLRSLLKKFISAGKLSPTQKQHDPYSQLVELNWEQFNRQVLANKDKYKGIFIQEATIDWNTPLYQRPQHISGAMSRRGYLVIYITMNLFCDSVNGFRRISEGLWVTNSEKIHGLNDVIRSFYSTSYAHTPESLLKNGKRGILVYEYIDHIDPDISGDSFNIRRLQALKDFAFSGGADYVVTSAKRLYDEAVNSIGKDRVIFVQNGVDVEHYIEARPNKDLPSQLTDFRNKYKVLIGYFGALAPWLWYEVISELVELRQDLGFVFIGPDYYGGAERLPKSDNTLRLDAVPYQELPAIGSSFDICFIPFKPGEIAKTTSPLKLFEYFALQKPVIVTSDMLECIAYDEVFHGDSPSSLSIAIDKALAVKDQEEYKAKLLVLARENDWSVRAKDYEAGLGLPVTFTIKDVQKIICEAQLKNKGQPR